MKRVLIATFILALAALACGQPSQPSLPTTPVPTLVNSVFDSGRTGYGFFPTPPEVSLESVLKIYKDNQAILEDTNKVKECPLKEYT